MRIGIDFDNTIVNYDSLFHRIAVEDGLVPPGTPPTKAAVRDYLRSVDREDDWTAMQGYVYGARMAEAAAFPGVFKFMRDSRDLGLELFIVSHKTRYPFRGERYDLHRAAHEWVSLHLKDARGRFIEEDSLFFELTKDAKIARIAELCCDYFIDDLPEILLAAHFPERTKPILFDPAGAHPESGRITPLSCWEDVGKLIGATVA
jgi:hypothetical protein